jgi:NAD(P)H-hydrate epimerase
VTVLAGKGNNGNDGRVAAAVLERRGARVVVIDAAVAPDRVEPCDLVVDAAYGTGFSGRYDAPEVPTGTPVLAVDIPSGINGDTGEMPGRALPADVTVTFAALKPGLLMGAGRDHAGHVKVVDIGVPVGEPTIGLVEDADMAWLPRRPHTSHKWATAIAVVAGSPGMEGAAVLCTRAAGRAGAGMVRLAVPGAGDRPGPWPLEAVRLSIGREGWADEVLEVLERCRALVVGPGLGREQPTQEAVRRLVARCPVPVVVDADGLFALGQGMAAREVVAGDGVDRPVVLTPHDGEYRRLTGTDPGPDRVAAARRLADATGAVALLKGSLTAVATPGSAERPGVLLSAAGSSALATAGRAEWRHRRLPGPRHGRARSGRAGRLRTRVGGPPRSGRGLALSRSARPRRAPALGALPWLRGPPGRLGPRSIWRRCATT